MCRIGQVQVGPKETNLIPPNTSWHYNLKPMASIVQPYGMVQANIFLVLGTLSYQHYEPTPLARAGMQSNIKVCIKIKAWESRRET